MMPVGPADIVTPGLISLKTCASLDRIMTLGGVPAMKMLLAVDGSDRSLQAVRRALALASEGLKCQYVLVNVQPPANLYEVVTAHDPDVIREVRGAAGADLLAPAEALLEAAGAAFESEVAGGEPAHLIVELAENYGCDAIVLGGRGDVAQAVLAASPVIVIVMPEPDEPA
jgi:nucleotide-binding universal stress UspA family protein